MKIKRIYLLIGIVGVCIASSFINQVTIVDAESTLSTKTEGTVGFYGTYQSEIEPQPGPPNGLNPISPSEGSPKPITNKGKLPQMGQLFSDYGVWFGIISLLLALMIWEKSRKEKITEVNY